MSSSSTAGHSAETPSDPTVESVMLGLGCPLDTQNPGQSESREVELDSQENPGQFTSREVELDSPDNPGQFTSREVELDSAENPGEIKSSEVELGCHNRMSCLAVKCLLNSCFSGTVFVSLFRTAVETAISEVREMLRTGGVPPL